MKDALRFEKVSKRYGRRMALDGLNLRVPSGSVYGLIGSNGAGKTTALSAAAGLLGICAGRIDLLEGGAFHSDRHAGRIGLLPQDAELPRDARALEQLVFYARLQGLSARHARAQAQSLLEVVHLTDRAQSPMRSLSHGMRKRVMIAQCFLGNPELVLLDEPLSGLDPREVVHMREFLQTKRNQLTLVISSHNLHEIELLCDHIGCIENGRCVREDTLDSFVQRSASLHYILTPGTEPPVPELRSALPDAEFQMDTTRHRLTCRYPSQIHEAATVNQKVISQLLSAGCSLIEIHRGDTLEDHYVLHDGVYGGGSVQRGVERS